MRITIDDKVLDNFNIDDSTEDNIKLFFNFLDTCSVAGVIAFKDSMTRLSTQYQNPDTLHQFYKVIDLCEFYLSKIS